MLLSELLDAPVYGHDGEHLGRVRGAGGAVAISDLWHGNVSGPAE